MSTYRQYKRLPDGGGGEGQEESGEGENGGGSADPKQMKV